MVHLVSLSIWGFSADVYLLVNNGLHYHKHCLMPSVKQGLFYAPPPPPPLLPPLPPVRIFLWKLNSTVNPTSPGGQPDLSCELLLQRRPFMWVNLRRGGNLPVFTSHLFRETPALSNRLIVFLLVTPLRLKDRRDNTGQVCWITHHSWRHSADWRVPVRIMTDVGLQIL